MSQVACVMPTKDRPELAFEVARRLLSQTLEPTCVVIVDASEPDDFVTLDSLLLTLNSKRVVHQAASMASLTGQRNEGIETALAVESWEFLQFMDDDVAFDDDFLERSVAAMTSGGWDGLCGATIEAKQKGTVFERAFCLSPPEPGLVSAGGRNAGYRHDPLAVSARPSEWLLGCSIYKRAVVENNRYWEMPGYVLYEDVEFSGRVAAQGMRLAWLPSLRLDHLELSRSSPDHFRNAYQGVYNRAKVLNSMSRPIGGHFWWSVVGLTARAATSAILGRPQGRFRLAGYLAAVRDVRRDFQRRALR